MIHLSVLNDRTRRGIILFVSWRCFDSLQLQLQNWATQQEVESFLRVSDLELLSRAISIAQSRLDDIKVLGKGRKI